MNSMSPLDKAQKLFSQVKHDLPSSVVVFFVALPLCLGIALASGAPLFSGIIAGIVGGVVVGLISNSSLGVSGPAAGLTVIVLSSIEKLGTFEAFLVAVVLAGIFQILLGVMRAGIIGYYFPSSVIKGMLSAIGIIIVLKQIPHAFGYDADYEGDLTFLQADGNNTFSEIVVMIDSVSPGAILISIISLAILIIWDTYLSKKYQFFKVIQGPIVAIAVGIVYQLITADSSSVLSLGSNHLVSVPVADNVSQFIGQFTFPDFSFLKSPDIWVVALTIAIVASLESLLSVEATDNLDPHKRTTNTNRELIAQGTGNFFSGLIGGLPVTQVIIRSSVNIQSGGKTKLSTIMHGLLLLTCVTAIPHVLNIIPLAVLASVLLVVGFKLINPAQIREMYRLGWSHFLPFIFTIVGVVTTDLLTGILLGLAVSVVIILKKSFKNSHFLHLENDHGNKRIRMTLAEEVYFLNKGAILSELNKIEDGSHVTIDMSKSVVIDHDVEEIIKNFKKTATERGMQVEVISRIEEPRLVGTKLSKEKVLEKMH